MANWSQDAGIDGHVAPAKASFRDLTRIPRSEIRICIAEDNPINQKIAMSFVTRLGLKCEAFNDGKQAVEALRQKSKENCEFHLVFMDCQMPIMDGYDATRAIRQDSDPNVREVIIIAMTASAIRGDREKCLEAGMNNYLAKPVRQNVLSAMLDEYLSNPPTDILAAQDTENLSKLRNNAKTSPKEGEVKNTKKPVRKIKRSIDLGHPNMTKPSAINKDQSTTLPPSNGGGGNTEQNGEPASSTATSHDDAAADDWSRNESGGDLLSAKDQESRPLAKFKKVVADSNEST